MKGKYLKSGEVFVIIDRGESLIYRKKDGGKFEALLNAAGSNVSKFKELPDSDQRNPKEKLKTCDVVRIDIVSTGFCDSVRGIKLISRRSLPMM